MDLIGFIIWLVLYAMLWRTFVDFMSIINFFGGRTYFLTLMLTVCGIVLAFHRQLDASYVAFMGAVGTLAVVKSAADDYHERNSSSEPPAPIQVFVPPQPPADEIIRR